DIASIEQLELDRVLDAKPARSLALLLEREHPRDRAKKQVTFGWIVGARRHEVEKGATPHPFAFADDATEPIRDLETTAWIVRVNAVEGGQRGEELALLGKTRRVVYGLASAIAIEGPAHAAHEA